MYADDPSFETHIDETIAKHPKEAALGGVPGITNKVRAYVDVTLRSKEAQESYHPEVRRGPSHLADISLWTESISGRKSTTFSDAVTSTRHWPYLEIISSR